jgi:hypothetical protein
MQNHKRDYVNHVGLCPFLGEQPCSPAIVDSSSRRMEKEETLRENPLCSRVIQPPKLSLLSHYSEIIQL